MSYTRNTPDYDAVQWVGDNLQQVADAVEAYYLFDNPPVVDGGSNLVFDLAASSINVVMPLNSWYVYNGRWGSLPTNEVPEFLSDADFQQKYT